MASVLWPVFHGQLPMTIAPRPWTRFWASPEAQKLPKSVLEAKFGSPWGLLGPFWGLLEPSGGLLGPSGSLLRPSWDLVGPSWDLLGPSWGLLGPSWGGLRGLLRSFWVIVSCQERSASIRLLRNTAPIDKTQKLLKNQWFSMLFEMSKHTICTSGERSKISWKPLGLNFGAVVSLFQVHQRERGPLKPKKVPRHALMVAPSVFHRLARPLREPGGVPGEGSYYP